MEYFRNRFPCRFGISLLYNLHYDRLLSPYLFPYLNTYETINVKMR